MALLPERKRAFSAVRTFNFSLKWRSSQLVSDRCGSINGVRHWPNLVKKKKQAVQVLPLGILPISICLAKLR